MIDYFRYYTSWAFYLIITIYYYRKLVIYKPCVYKYPFVKLFCFLCVFSIFNNINGDYYNYIRYLRDMETYLYLENIEYIYHIIAEILNYNNLLFRTIIIASTYILLFFIITRYSKEKKVALVFFICIYWMSFSSSIRSCISDAFFFFGLLLFVNRKQFFSFVVMLLFITMAMFLHKSIFMLVPCTIISFFPLKKGHVKFYILLLPIWIYIGLQFYHYVLNAGYLDGSSYLSGEEIEEKNIKAVLVRIISEASIIILTILNLYVNSSCQSQKFSLYAYLYKFMVFSMIVYVVLLFFPTSNYVHDRFFMHLAIPNMLLMSYLPYNTKSRKISVYMKLMILLWLVIIQIGILRRLLDQEAIVKRLF